MWHDDSNGDSPLIVIMSTKVTKEYLAYLDSLHISWIVCGEKHIDLHKAVEILYTEFGVERIRTEVAGTELVHLVANYAQFLLIQADFFADGSCAVWHDKTLLSLLNGHF